MIEFEFESTPETDEMLKQICVGAIKLVSSIVRCKDCKHWFYFWESEKYHCTESDKHPWDCPIREEDDFCSRGERRGEEEC